ncbi:alpha/beta fold hydrolase [Oleomonas cavernae]|uniref:Alpha/beta fold hydrolase n=1 Tax=Oleomonas cavernae TaxID=2320859 RepID=A0A418WT24_9PROT|nr:alpha/beta fold hydrolase [Oleomonas cavernae]RJF94375.1 alpha/beta fold hydrolase [Oleomonas cavernae]
MSSPNATRAMPEPRFVRNDDVDLATYQWGGRDGDETIVFLHGYPDAAAVWADIAALLADRFRVVAFDMRGTGQSTTPSGRNAYGFDRLIGDLEAVLDAVSPDRPVHIVGHDWGALQGWEAVLGEQLKGRIASFSTAAPSLDHVGHWFHGQLRAKTLAGLGRFVRRALASSYMLMLQIPVIPEMTWRLGLGRLWPRLVSRLERLPVAGRHGQVRDAISGLGLYRTNLLPTLRRPSSRSTDLPVQLLVMTRDPFVPAFLFDGMEQWAPNLRRTAIDSGHWGILARPADFAGHVADFVTQQRN